jgi:hypothetical protein
MPAIGTSSDQYQHRDPALTTYRRNAGAPTLAEAMTERSEDRRKAAAIERRQVEGKAVDGRSLEGRAVERRPEVDAKPAANSAARPTETVTPQRVVHELYAPPSRLRREHDDRHAMITGGTIDVRA